MNPKTDFFFNKPSAWQKEYAALRVLCLETGLTEELKWGCPCYLYNKKNVVLIHGFKEYCALLFMKGALLNNDSKLLIQQTENVQSARQIRFSTLGDISKNKKAILAHIYEAIEVEKAGLTVTFKKADEYPIPEEFQVRLNKNTKLKKSFYALTPGRQRGYLFYFGQAKQVATREARIDKYVEKILAGKGLED
ncbi:MAG: YdeI/OmpD-associated family protein [Chitinophagaceae bacterium]|nr:YdeI/OmpD-associated family protein [Chitinophagaceae bacterium]